MLAAPRAASRRPPGSLPSLCIGLTFTWGTAPLGGRSPAGQDGAAGAGGPGVAGATKRQLDAATMWESLSGGEDPTEDEPAENAAEKAPPSARTSN